MFFLINQFCYKTRFAINKIKLNKYLIWFEVENKFHWIYQFAIKINGTW